MQHVLAKLDDQAFWLINLLKTNSDKLTKLNLQISGIHLYSNILYIYVNHDLQSQKHEHFSLFATRQ